MIGGHDWLLLARNMWDCETNPRWQLDHQQQTALQLPAASTCHSSHIAGTDFHHYQPFLKLTTLHTFKIIISLHTQNCVGCNCGFAGGHMEWWYILLDLHTWTWLTLGSEKYFANMSSLPLLGFIIPIQSGSHDFSAFFHYFFGFPLQLKNA